ncbi:MAG: hypothetical protein RR436_05695 [Clostridia bacterium]
MVKESVIKSNKPVAIIGVIIILGLMLYTLPVYLDLGKFRGLYEIALFVLMAIGITINIVFRLSKYTVMLIEDELIIRKTSHKINKVVITLNAREIIAILKRSDPEFKQYSGYYHMHRFCETNNKSSDTIVVYNKGFIKSYLAFEPSDNFLDLLKTRVLPKVSK